MKSRGMILLITLMNLLAFGRGSRGGEDGSLYACSENGKYTSNSTYRANLNSLMSSLSSNMLEFGLYTQTSIGQNTDKVYVFAICIAGQTLDDCRDCVESASHDILQQCPNQKEAILWGELCMLRYSNNSMLRNPTTRPLMLLYNTQNASNEDGQFMQNLEMLLSELRDKAAGGSLFKFGAGSRNTSGPDPTIYGLVWCTPDLSTQDCSSCLNKIYPMIHEPGGLKKGCRVAVPSCYLRYELYSFYNETRLRQLQLVALPPPSPPPPPPPPPPLSPLPSPPGKNDDDNTKLVILTIVPTGICLMLIASAVIILRKRKKRRKQRIIKNAEEISIVESLQYDFGTIRAATSDFGDASKLGRGGFGVVYWGKFEDGQEIAAKRLSNDSGQGDIEFKNEALLVARLQHRNLVKLLGFSIEGMERILVYEFVQNASLDKFIFDPARRSELGWDARNKIIGGVARGLLYLHEDSRLRIIHRDLKASNVLLDGNMNPKIADFGMARLFKQDETQGDTNKIVGTYGYMSPEYAMYGQFSIKSDVFSFGVLILEIISGRRNKIVRGGENVEDLLTLTWENWRGGTTTDMIDSILRNGMGSVDEMLKCIHIGLLCVQESVSSRPTMTSVVSMLNSSTNTTFPLPLEPAFYTANRYGPIVPLIGKNDSKSGASLNEMSTSKLYPR